MKIGILYKHSFPPAKKEAVRLKEWLRKRGIEVYMEEMDLVVGVKSGPETTSIPSDISWAIVLGGDGTLLGAARRVGHFDAPIMGVNLGGLGFLTSIPQSRLYSAIEKLLRGELKIEERMMLETVVIRDRQEICRYKVLNDVVVNKGPLARILELDVYISDEFLTTFRADGLIVATPTGSTAYNLSAGGPIIYPTISNLIITPICPFTISNRPLILPDTLEVSISIKKETEEAVLLTFDGQVGFEISWKDKVKIKRAENRIRLVSPPYQSYFEILRTKLLWGGSTLRSDEHHKNSP